MTVPSPPLQLGKGHLAMLLAAGHLDGLVRPADGQPPHVVRGTAKKVKFVSEKEQDVLPDGQVTCKTIYSERIDLTVRAVTQNGLIRTFNNKSGKEVFEDDDSQSS